MKLGGVAEGDRGGKLPYAAAAHLTGIVRFLTMPDDAGAATADDDADDADDGASQMITV